MFVCPKCEQMSELSCLCMLITGSLTMWAAPKLRTVDFGMAAESASDCTENATAMEPLDCVSLQMEPSTSNASSQMISTSNICPRTTIRRKIYSARERRLRKIILRQRVTICHLNKKGLHLHMKLERPSNVNFFEGPVAKLLTV